MWESSVFPWDHDARERHSSELQIVDFNLRANPSAAELSSSFKECNATEAVFLFSFGDATASHRVSDAWRSCCELYIQAEFLRRSQLREFWLAGERLFGLRYFDQDELLCTWSRDHVFLVSRTQVAASLETLVQHSLGEATNPRMNEFVRLGASLLESSPYAALRA